MSEYQYVEFRAVDRRLTDDELQFMETQSSRAEITKTSFTNEYNFGEFRGDVVEMMRRGYDVHLHYANFGTRKLVFRLPQGLPPGGELYLYADFLTWTPDGEGPGGLLEIHPEADAGTYSYYMLDDLDWIVDVREQLLQGDLRPLFLMWLATWPYDDSVQVPAGLSTLPPWAESLADFYELSAGQLQAVAETSPPLSSAKAATTGGPSMEAALKKLKKANLVKLIVSLAESDAATRHHLTAELRTNAPVMREWPTSDSSYTWEELGGSG